MMGKARFMEERAFFFALAVRVPIAVPIRDSRPICSQPLQLHFFLLFLPFFLSRKCVQDDKYGGAIFVFAQASRKAYKKGFIH
jgi:hypothetical protein